jgi:hypothetical protein
MRCLQSEVEINGVQGQHLPTGREGRILFILLFLIMLGVMSVGADYGARMVYDYNAGGIACSQPIDFTK